MVKIVAATDKRCLLQQRAYKVKGAKAPANPHPGLAPRVRGLVIRTPLLEGMSDIPTVVMFAPGLACLSGLWLGFRGPGFKESQARLGAKLRARGMRK